MKNIVSCISLRSELLATMLISISLFCTPSLQAESQDPFEVTRGHSSSHRPKEKECRECDFVITAKDIACGTVVITKPGYYCLCEDAVFNPSPNQIGNPYIGAITIDASNVTLDLRGRTLSQISKAVLNVDGIIVNPGLTNIIIKNGTVRDFSDAGIRVGAVSTTTVPLVTELSISDIRSFNNGLSTAIADPNGIGDGLGGAVILNAQDVTISNCEFNENAYAGLWTFNITKLSMGNSHCDDNTSANFNFSDFQTTFGGTVAGESADIVITKCTFNRNSSGGFALGFNISFAFGSNATSNILFDSCQFNDTTVTVSDTTIAASLFGSTEASGVHAARINNLTLRNCEANGTSLTLNVPLTGGFPPVDQQLVNLVRGFALQRTTNATITNCSSSGNTFQNNSGFGVRNVIESFAFGGVQQLYLSQCQAYGNSNSYNADSSPLNVPSLLIAEGFDFSGTGNAVVEDCTSSGHHQAAVNPAEGQFSIVAGFNAHFFQCTNCGPIVFRRCVATGNVDTGTFDGLAFGFSTREPQFAGTALGTNTGPYVFESCIAESNTTNSGTGSGFDIFNLVNSKIINCFAEGNNIGINVSDFTLPPATNEFGSVNNIFRGNVVSANTAFGIQDTTAAKSNAYYSNQAKNNGPTPATTNYSGAGVFPIPSCSTTTLCCTPANLTPVLYWTLPNAPCTLNTNCVVSTPLDNLSIVN